MTNEQMGILKNTLDEYGGLIVICDYDFKIHEGKTLLTHVYHNEETDKIHYFAGDIIEDKHAEEIFPNEKELDDIYNLITKNF